MDLLRSLIKCLYCDYSPDDYLAQILNNKLHAEGYSKSKECLKELLHQRETQYNDEAIASIVEIADKTWFAADSHGRSLNLEALSALSCFCEHTFDVANQRVKFEHLLQWRDLSFCLGEDFLMCTALSEQIITDFEWKTPCMHDFNELNTLFRNGLHDLHVHLEGGMETAELVWIRLMSNPEQMDAGWDQRFKEHERESLQLFWKINSPKTLKQWILLVGNIRKQVYGYLHDGFDWKTCNENILIACRTDAVETENQLMGEDTGFGAVKLDGEKQSVEIVTDDYAKPVRESNSPYSYQAGERWLMYKALHTINGQPGAPKELAEWFYLYMLIKILFRRECVQMNMRIGLNNYNQYYGKFNISDTIVADVKKKLDYIYETSVSATDDSLEVRGSVNSLNHTIGQYHKHLHLLGTFYKKPSGKDDSIAALRVDLKKKADDFIAIIKQNQQILHDDLNDSKSVINPIVGLDTTGSDLTAHPDVIAPYIRYVREKTGLENFTYHIAEDFMDVVDGLRALDELITFVGSPTKLRLGHASALGVNIKQFYTERKRNVLCTRQCLLDNLVWLYAMNKNGDKSVLQKLHDEASPLFSVLYAEFPFNIDTYRMSMLLRSDVHDETTMPGVSECVLYCQTKGCCDARNIPEVKELCNKYQEVGLCDTETILYRMPEEFIDLVENARLNLLDKINKGGFEIESCPTSNLIIGPFDMYINLPTFTFLYNKICVSVNTDTKGIFATSLYLEFSLLACALKKGRCNDQVILQMITRLLQNNEKQKFDVPKLERLLEQV